jgi:hypothetical protein
MIGSGSGIRDPGSGIRTYGRTSRPLKNAGLMVNANGKWQMVDSQGLAICNLPFAISAVQIIGGRE